MERVFFPEFQFQNLALSNPCLEIPLRSIAEEFNPMDMGGYSIPRMTVWRQLYPFWRTSLHNTDFILEMVTNGKLFNPVRQRRSRLNPGNDI